MKTPEMADDKDRSGERAMISTYRDDRGRKFYSFTPTAIQFWGGLMLTLFALLGGIWKTAGVFLRPEVKAWVAEDFKPQIEAHREFVTREELSAVSYSIRAMKTDQEKRVEALGRDLDYMRHRIDAIADRVGAK